MSGVEDNHYDTVYSSHLLEHLPDPYEALRNWWRILKPSGYLIVFVPHKDLYEKKADKPSRWNSDHKWFFLPTLHGQADGRTHWLGLADIAHVALPHHELIYVKTCDEGFTRTNPKHHADGEYSIEMVLRKPCRKGFTFTRTRTMPPNTHRHGWNEVMRHVKERWATEQSPVEFDDFLELTYLWTTPTQKAKDWVGIAHACEAVPFPYNPLTALPNYFRIPEFLKSLDRCRGLICLSEKNSESMRKLLEMFDRKTDVYTLLHPTEFDVPKWNPDLAFEKKQVVNLGYWMRDFSAFHFLQVPDGWKKLIVASNAVECAPAQQYYEKETKRIEETTGQKSVPWEVPPWYEPEEYDSMLQRSVVFIRLLGEGANNAVLECIARGTPVLVNPLLSVVEYVGEGYPLYYASLQEARSFLEDSGRIRAGHDFLMECPARKRLTYDYFAGQLEQFL